MLVNENNKFCKLMQIINNRKGFNTSARAKTVLATSFMAMSVSGCGIGESITFIEQDSAKNDKKITSFFVSDNTAALTKKPTEPKLAYADDLKILSYNVYLMSEIIAPWSQSKRVDMILDSDILQNQDVVVLSELFENKPAQKLLDGIKAEYPYQTPVLGRSHDNWNQSLGKFKYASFDDGGVAIVSRWPIKEQIQYIYKSGCGADALANKGFVYARLDKNGADYHVIGTHAQAEDGSCISTPASVRKLQFLEMQKFIADKNIPVDEVLFIAGDLNVIKNSEEYPDMLETLKVNTPDAYAGLDATWDPATNGIASHNYPTLESEYLDYILVSSQHAQPSFWHNQALDVTTAPWQNKGKSFSELSDHYPIAGFSYADENTRTQSYRDTNRPYADIKLRNKANGAYLTVDKYNQDGWVMVNGTANDAANSFMMDNWYPKGKAFCIMNSDLVQLASNYYGVNAAEKTLSANNAQNNQFYLNWWLGGGSGNYAYYTKKNNGSDRLRVKILNDDGDCLKDSDEIALYDTSTVSAKQYYLQRRSYGMDTDKLYMWSNINDTIGDDEIFTIEMQTGKKEDWSDKLTYQPVN